MNSTLPHAPGPDPFCIVDNCPACAITDPIEMARAQALWEGQQNAEKAVRAAIFNRFIELVYRFDGDARVTDLWATEEFKACEAYLSEEEAGQTEWANKER